MLPGIRVICLPEHIENEGLFLFRDTDTGVVDIKLKEMLVVWSFIVLAKFNDAFIGILQCIVQQVDQYLF